MPRMRTRSVGWLLALLTLRLGRSISRATLAGTLWPDSDETQALQNLRHDLVSLRKALGSESGRLESPTRETLRFEVSEREADVLCFDAAIRRGDPDSLRLAVQLYTGPLLEGCDKPWAIAERLPRIEQCLRALDFLAREAAEAGLPTDAIALSRRAVSIDPLRESSVRLLMAAQAAEGDAAGAIEQYRVLRQRLHAELHTAPDDSTTQLFHEIRQRPASTSTEPIRKRSSAPRMSLRQPPLPLNRLLGREEEVQQVRAHLSAQRLVTLIGAGGVGKTRLAGETAAQISHEGEREVAWVELAPESDPGRLMGVLAAAFGLAEEDGGEAAIQVILAKAEEAPLLIVFDNCEHLIEEVARLVESLLAASTGIKVLTTSRQRLGLVGEVAWRLPALTVPNESLVVEGEMLAFSAVQLFVERAMAARPGIVLDTPEDLADVCTICRRLDGIPLAIELAAARVTALSPADIAQRLDQRFALLTGGARTALPRQKTLKSLIAWSYDLLDENEKRAFRDLSVLRGIWTLEAAESICRQGNDVDVLDTLASLIDKSLVIAETHGHEVGYRMLESVREYSAERLLEAGEADATRARHFGYFISLGARLSSRIPDDRAAGMSMEAAIGNFSSALAWAKSSPETIGHYVRLVSSIWPFWLHHGSVFEGCVHVQAALDSDEEGAHLQALCTGAGALIEALHYMQYEIAARSTPGLEDVVDWRADTARSRKGLESALRIQQKVGSKADYAITLRCLASLAEREKDSVRYRELAMEVVRVSRELDNRFFLAMSLHECGCGLFGLGLQAEAFELLSEALPLFQLPKGETTAHFAYNNLALVTSALGDIEAARGLRLEALKCVLKTGEWDSISWSLAGFAEAGGGGHAAEVGAVLLGAASVVARERFLNIGLRDRAASGFRVALGDETFETAFDRGVTIGPMEGIRWAQGALT